MYNDLYKTCEVTDILMAWNVVVLIIPVENEY